MQSLESHTTLQTIFNLSEAQEAQSVWTAACQSDTGGGKYITPFQWRSHLGLLCFNLVKANITNLQLRDGSLAKLNALEDIFEDNSLALEFWKLFPSLDNSMR